MASNRIQKLLFSEYSDFEDIVLVEGPFAETDRHGKGIRQVQIGLTPTKLIFASYFVEPVAVEELGDQWKPRRGQDLDIESFELVSAYPVECVNLSVYRRHRRQTLKARFCNGRVSYYEIGGWQERKMLWSVWCERIKFLSPYESGTSVSETSVGTSSSGSSSLYIAHSSLSVTQAGKPTLWCHYACSQANFQGSWVDPHVYLGPTYYEKGVNNSSLQNGAMTGNRFQVSKPVSTKRRMRHSKEHLILSTEHELMAEEAVEMWEYERPPGRGHKVRRRYALSLCPYLFGGLGPWRASKPSAFSIQTKKNVSLVDLRWDAEECLLPMSKSRLLRTTSEESLVIPALPQEQLYNPSHARRQHNEITFWIRFPEELMQWRHIQYKTQQRHFRATRKRIDPRIFGIKDNKRRDKRQQRGKGKRGNPSLRSQTYSIRSTEHHGGGGDSLATYHPYRPVNDEDEEGWLLPVFRFRSSSLAHQLTMVHKQLFLEITTLDLSRARADMSSWRAPSLRAVVFFSYRISCLVVNHILQEHEVKKRARVIVKLMSVSNKCHKIHSQMSAESVLRGLHSPPVYRLHRTWAFVRKHHPTNYRRFEDLSRRYYDCRTPLFQKTYDDMVRIPPFLPSVSLLIAVLLGSLPDLPQVQSFKFSSDCSESCHQTKPSVGNSTSARTPGASPLRRFLSSLQLRPGKPPSPSSNQPSSCQSDTHLESVSRETLLEHLDKFFTPISDAPARRALQDLEYFLECHQAAAIRYQIPINPRVRAFLLHSRHPDMRTLFKQSLLIEP